MELLQIADEMSRLEKLSKLLSVPHQTKCCYQLSRRLINDSKIWVASRGFQEQISFCIFFLLPNKRGKFSNSNQSATNRGAHAPVSRCSCATLKQSLLY